MTTTEKRRLSSLSRSFRNCHELRLLPAKKYVGQLVGRRARMARRQETPDPLERPDRSLRCRRRRQYQIVRGVRRRHPRSWSRHSQERRRAGRAIRCTRSRHPFCRAGAGAAARPLSFLGRSAPASMRSRAHVLSSRISPLIPTPPSISSIVGSATVVQQRGSASTAGVCLSQRMCPRASKMAVGICRQPSSRDWSEMRTCYDSLCPAQRASRSLSFLEAFPGIQDDGHGDDAV